jgi:hypothetical protein
LVSLAWALRADLRRKEGVLFSIFFAVMKGRSSTTTLYAFCLTNKRTKGKVRNSLQSENAVRWTIFENWAVSSQQSAFSHVRNLILDRSAPGIRRSLTMTVWSTAIVPPRGFLRLRPSADRKVKATSLKLMAIWALKNADKRIRPTGDRPVESVFSFVCNKSYTPGWAM